MGEFVTISASPIEVTVGEDVSITIRTSLPSGNYSGFKLYLYRSFYTDSGTSGGSQLSEWSSISSGINIYSYNYSTANMQNGGQYTFYARLYSRTGALKDSDETYVTINYAPRETEWTFYVDGQEISSGENNISGGTLKARYYQPPHKGLFKFAYYTLTGGSQTVSDYSYASSGNASNGYTTSGEITIGYVSTDRNYTLYVWGSPAINYGGKQTSISFRLEQPYFGKIETIPLFPQANTKVLSLSNRRALFYTIADRDVEMTNIEVSFIANGTAYAYSYSTFPQSFDLRVGIFSNDTLTSSRAFEIGTDSLENGVFWAFKFPVSSNTQITNIVARITPEDYRVISEDTSPTDLALATVNNAQQGTYITKALKDSLLYVSNNLGMSYNTFCSYVGIGDYPDIASTDSANQNSIVRQDIFKLMMDFYKNVYTYLNILFPSVYTPNATLNQMYLPQIVPQYEIAEANTETPKSTQNGNFFNNLIWILKNLL